MLGSGSGRAGDVVIDQSLRHGVSRVCQEVLPQQLAVVSSAGSQSQQVIVGVSVGIHLEEVGQECNWPQTVDDPCSDWAHQARTSVMW